MRIKILFSAVNLPLKDSSLVISKRSFDSSQYEVISIMSDFSTKSINPRSTPLAPFELSMDNCNDNLLVEMCDQEKPIGSFYTNVKKLSQGKCHDNEYTVYDKRKNLSSGTVILESFELLEDPRKLSKTKTEKIKDTLIEVQNKAKKIVKGTDSIENTTEYNIKKTTDMLIHMSEVIINKKNEPTQVEPILATLEFSAKNLAKKDLFGKGDPYLVISERPSYSSQFAQKLQSNVVKNKSDPHWEPFEMHITDWNVNLLVEIYDKDLFTKDDLIGSFYTNFHNLSEGKCPKNEYECMKHGKPSGTVLLESFLQMDKDVKRSAELKGMKSDISGHLDDEKIPVIKSNISEHLDDEIFFELPEIKSDISGYPIVVKTTEFPDITTSDDEDDIFLDAIDLTELSKVENSEDDLYLDAFVSKSPDATIPTRLSEIKSNADISKNLNALKSTKLPEIQTIEEVASIWLDAIQPTKLLIAPQRIKKEIKPSSRQFRRKMVKEAQDNLMLENQEDENMIEMTKVGQEDRMVAPVEVTKDVQKCNNEEIVAAKKAPKDTGQKKLNGVSPMPISFLNDLKKNQKFKERK